MRNTPSSKATTHKRPGRSAKIVRQKGALDRVERDIIFTSDHIGSLKSKGTDQKVINQWESSLTRLQREASTLRGRVGVI